MNILFLTMVSGLKNIETSGIYTDLMRKFRDKGNEVYIIYPRERRLGLPTEVSHKGKVHLLGVKTLNLTKTNLIEKDWAGDVGASIQVGVRKTFWEG